MHTSKHINNQHIAFIYTYTYTYTYEHKLTCIYTNDYKNILILFQTYTYIHSNESYKRKYIQTCTSINTLQMSNILVEHIIIYRSSSST